MITNKLNLPDAIVRAVANDPYDKGDCDFSATEIIAPPHLKNLYRLNKDKIQVDAADRIWSLFGQSIHNILERAAFADGGAGYIVEHRFVGSFDVDGVRVRLGSKIDTLNLDGLVLDDYKVTSVYKFQVGKDIPKEYIHQMNVQAECILRDWGKEVNRARIIGILRDWRRAEAMQGDGYPPFQVVPMEIPIWPQSRREAYIMDRLRLHMQTSPEPCSAEERWEKETKWALMKKGSKRALRLYSTPSEAQYALENIKTRPGEEYLVETRPGARTRCESYCEVADFCEPFKAYKEVQSCRETSEIGG